MVSRIRWIVGVQFEFLAARMSPGQLQSTGPYSCRLTMSVRAMFELYRQSRRRKKSTVFPLVCAVTNHSSRAVYKGYLAKART